ncbi:hypothetical protein SKAU_G00320020 [Synaphobranchus kaupii]|uniref:Uncharacterized protein n=1 Tax=Synaphobranchus kaupii TaxID=118154 RepID=A0A9Q1IJS7_SYNKA|nr:hypothetical protein SKAU_G00320020 [Synaphobranchus kaupii]
MHENQPHKRACRFTAVAIRGGGGNAGKYPHKWSQSQAEFPNRNLSERQALSRDHSHINGELYPVRRGHKNLGVTGRAGLLRTGSGDFRTGSEDPRAQREVGAQTLGNMSDAILTFQVQLSGVMETVLKSAMYEITRLVEDSFLEEVARSKQEVEALRQRLEWSESRRREREGGGRSRCVDCGRVGVSSEGTEDRPSGTQSGAEGAPPLPLSKSCSEPEWSPTVRQDTAPSSGSLLPEQQSSGHRAEETCGLYESGQERVAHSLSLAGRQRCSRQHNDPNSERVTWTTFKLGDSDNEADGLDPSPAAVPEPASPSAQRDLPPGLAEEGAGNSVSPLQYLNVKSEGGMADWLLIKEEAEMQPVCSEEIRWDVAHREPWDRGDLQMEGKLSWPSGLARAGLQRGREFLVGARKSHAQRQREYRARVKRDPSKYLELRASETMRVRMFRQRRSAEAVARDRETARLRMREYRWRKKHTEGVSMGGMAMGGMAMGGQ